MDKCYNCRIELNEKNRTREHIPAQNTFGGFPPEYKNNRITVPACFNCNNDYSKIDQEIRDAIGIMSNGNNDSETELARKAFKSIMRRRNWKERVTLFNGKVYSVSFGYETLKKLHIKNFKGVFHKNMAILFQKPTKLTLLQKAIKTKN